MTRPARARSGPKRRARSASGLLTNRSAPSGPAGHRHDSRHAVAGWERRTPHAARTGLIDALDVVSEVIQGRRVPGDPVVPEVPVQLQTQRLPREFRSFGGPDPRALLPDLEMPMLPAPLGNAPERATETVGRRRPQPCAPPTPRGAPSLPLHRACAARPEGRSRGSVPAAGRRDRSYPTETVRAVEKILFVHGLKHHNDGA